jgi:hypothetical protein
MGDPSQGVGVSVDQVLKNVNWVAVTDRDFFLRGDVSEQEALDRTTLDRALNKALAAGFYNNVQVQEKYLNDPSFNPQKLQSLPFLLNETVGTSFGLNLARDVYCSRIPVPKENLAVAVETLNQLNRKYYAGNNYVWDAIKNNCAHLAHNALAYAGFWDLTPTDGWEITEFLNLALPANEFIDSMERGNEGDLGNLRELFWDKQVHDGILNSGWSPIQPGVLAEAIPFHSYENLIYKHGTKFTILDFPFFEPQHREFRFLLQDDKYKNLRANLLWFKDRYQKVLKNRHSVFYWLTGQGISKHGVEHPNSPLEREFTEFYNKYYAYINAQALWVENSLKLLDQGE